jgi:hypothetical protein
MAGFFNWSRPFRPLIFCLVLILLFTGLPMIGVLVASGVASALGCTLNEGDIHPCPLFGFDLGGLLYDFFVSGWFGLLTIPIGLCLLILWGAVAIIVAITHRRARS